MAEEAVVEQPKAPSSVEVITPNANLFSDSMWSANPVVVDPVKTDAPITEVKPEPTTTKPEDAEIVDEMEYLERQTGYKSWDDIKALKAEVEQLRTKAQTPAEIKFANEHSQKLFEAFKEGKEDDVFGYLDTKRKLSSAANLPAADAIKLHLQQTNPHFKPEDIEDVFEERYSIPKKPIQKIDDDPDEFNERIQEWNTRVAKINRAIERDSVTAKQELAQRITQLVPPEIPQAQPVAAGPDPKVLEAVEATRNAYVQKLETEFGSFDAFNTRVKDESGELPIAFKVDDKDRAEIKSLVQDAVFKNLDVNDYFTNRWFAKDATGALVPNIQKMMADFILLEKTEKVFQGIANNSAASRLAHQIKLNSNINVSGEKVKTEIKQDENAKMLETFWKS